MHACACTPACLRSPCINNYEQRATAVAVAADPRVLALEGELAVRRGALEAARALLQAAGEAADEALRASEWLAARAARAERILDIEVRVAEPSLQACLWPAHCLKKLRPRLVPRVCMRMHACIRNASPTLRIFSCSCSSFVLLLLCRALRARARMRMHMRRCWS